VHFGKSKLEDGEMCFSADTLFSALFLEAMKKGKEKLLLEYVKEEKLLFTDAFPFSVKQEGSKGKKEYCYFLPKPMCPVKRGEEEGREKEHSILKKAYKKLKYLSIDSISDYVEGKLDPLEELKKQNFGSFFSQEMVRILEDEDNLPYRVEQFQFAEDAGLYCIFSTEDKDVEDLLIDLLESLSYVGIGGKRASGKGKFSITAGILGEEIAEKIQQVRKTGLTFAPEAGTQRMRDVINKGITEEELQKAVSKAFEMGWNSVKLYFMIGLPTERYEDLDGIKDLAYQVIDIYRDIHGGKIRGKFGVTISTSTFVPKPFTPFQWHRQDTGDEIRDKQKYLVAKLRNGNIRYNYHDSQTSLMEAVFARGDRRLGEVLLDAFKAGAKFDGWSEYFDLDRWLEAMDKNGLDPSFYAHRDRSYDEVFPWDHIDVGVTKEFLIRENELAKQDKVTEDCRHGCKGCGVNTNDIGRGLC